jgi:hypothetical protein
MVGGRGATKPHFSSFLNGFSSFFFASFVVLLPYHTPHPFGHFTPTNSGILGGVGRFFPFGLPHLEQQLYLVSGHPTQIRLLDNIYTPLFLAKSTSLGGINLLSFYFFVWSIGKPIYFRHKPAPKSYSFRRT